MLERLGVEARKVMAAAERQAVDLGSPVVGCAHLLLALVDAGVTGPALAYADVLGGIAMRHLPASASPLLLTNALESDRPEEIGLDQR